MTRIEEKSLALAKARLEEFLAEVNNGTLKLADLVDIVRTDASMLIIIMNLTKTGLRRRVQEYIDTYNAPKRKPGRPRTQPAMQPPPSTERLHAAQTVYAQAAQAAVLVIDGTDIMDWTIGQCLSTAKRKDFEARVLRAIGTQLGHLNHTETIGNVLNAAQVKEIIKQNRG